MPFESTFHEIAALLLLASAVGAVAIFLRQPLIVAFIAVGVLVGPDALGWVQSAEQIALFAKVGIAVLLFVVGLRLDVELIRSIGGVSLLTGLGQVVFTSVIGLGLALLLGLALVPAIYVAVALTFSSTIIIVKLLSDKREIDSLHGRIALGFLIVQDLVVVLALIVLTAVGAGGASGALGAEVAGVVARGVGALVAMGLLMRFVLPGLLRRLAHSKELLVLFAIAWAVSLAAGAELLGFSQEVGAFLAGVSIASTPYREAIGARLVGIRDFMLLFFFIALGAGLDLGVLGAQVGPALVLSAFVLVGNPLIVMAIMGVMGYRKRTGFLAGLTVAQISEFSLILAAAGLGLGHLTPETVGLITLVGLITIGLSTYMILYSHPLYDRLSPFLGLFERRVPHREPAGAFEAPGGPLVIQFGLGRYGGALAAALRARGVGVIGVDFDPRVVEDWCALGLEARYGDAEDGDFPETLPLGQTTWVVSTLPLKATNLVLLDALRHHRFAGRVAVTAHSDDEAGELRRAGADRVLRPYLDAAQEAAGALMGEAAR